MGERSKKIRVRKAVDVALEATLSFLLTQPSHQKAKWGLLKGVPTKKLETSWNPWTGVKTTIK